jgi:hypothetical protein
MLRPPRPTHHNLPTATHPPQPTHRELLRHRDLGPVWPWGLSVQVVAQHAACLVASPVAGQVGVAAVRGPGRGEGVGSNLWRCHWHASICSGECMNACMVCYCLAWSCAAHASGAHLPETHIPSTGCFTCQRRTHKALPSPCTHSIALISPDKEARKTRTG